MAGLAKSTNKVSIFKIDNKRAFAEKFNLGLPSEQFQKSCKKAGELFGKPKKN